MSPQITMTPAIITAMPGAGSGSPSRIAASMARHRRRARAAVTTPARISRTPTVSHAQWSVCPARSRAAATPEATSASAVRSHARYVRSFASWNCASGVRRSLMSAPRFRDAESLAGTAARKEPPGASGPSPPSSGAPRRARTSQLRHAKRPYDASSAIPSPSSRPHSARSPSEATRTRSRRWHVRSRELVLASRRSTRSGGCGSKAGRSSRRSNSLLGPHSATTAPMRTP